VNKLTLQEILMTWLNSGSFWTFMAVVLLTLVEITPIKFNPLSWIAKKIGAAFNGDVMKEIVHLKTEMGTVKEEVQSIKTDVSDIREEAKEREANNRRTRILEFGDEILHGVDYSKEHFDNVLMDISAYEEYCDEHPHYMNNVAKATIKHIKKIYQKCLDEDGFL
jgi:hypothetical protein